jgi:hypothetical protein
VRFVGVGVTEARGALDEDDDSDEEAVVEGEGDVGSSPSVAVGRDGELAGVLVAGAVVGGEEGVERVVSRCEDTLVSSPMEVVPVEWELPTSADTGFCPMSSIPVTMPMATTKTATA